MLFLIPLSSMVERAPVKGDVLGSNPRVGALSGVKGNTALPTIAGRCEFDSHDNSMAYRSTVGHRAVNSVIQVRILVCQLPHRRGPDMLTLFECAARLRLWVAPTQRGSSALSP